MAGKKILVLGGTGPLGVYFCQKALANGHQLTIYARNPSKLPEDVSSNAAVNVHKSLAPSTLFNADIEAI
jgi:uncharacterized protein YbjT (DUF2867 family)